jgi:hypothetical protein
LIYGIYRKKKFESYPEHIAILLQVRHLIFSVANQDGIDDITETLKWGEPSYISTIGSTIRIDWKEKNPEHYGIYFHCKTSLIETFTYEGNRAIIFSTRQLLPSKELSHCISLSLRYKKIKHLDLLGA